MKKRILNGLLSCLLLASPFAQAQKIPAPQAKKQALYSQSFSDTPLEMLVDFYNEWIGRTLIIQADLKKKITLKFTKLTQEEAMQAIETILAMNGVALVPMGDKFLKVVNIATARQEGMPIKSFDPDEAYTAADQLMSQVIPLRYVVYADVQEIVQQLIHGYGKVVKMDRVNSILVTDTSANIARIVEVIAMVDQPLEKIEPRIYQLKHAEASSVSAKLKELVEAAKTKKSSQAVVAAPRTIPGVIRAPRTRTTTSAGDSFADETQMIQGEVKFVSDERTNILIIFSKAANFNFFDNIIKVLDVPVDPEVVVEVVNLEYAEAKEISGILNEFVGAAKETEPAKGAVSGATATGNSKSVREVIAARTKPAATRPVSAAAKNAMGRLSEDTKILSDERTNSLLLMGRRSDIDALKSVIATLDVMLEQVLIEAVILSIGLGDDFSTGIQWVYDSLKTADPARHLAGFSAGNLPGVSTNSLGALGKSALSYYATFPEINIQALISATKSDNNAQILSTPVVMTTDNTEATITVAEERPVITSSTSATSGYSARSTYQYKTIGINLTVTPHINPDRFVLMEIKQSADDVGGNVTVDGNEVPIISKREISATVAVQDRSTIVLGGLIRKSNTKSATKIPILGDIPLIGWLFSSHKKSDDRSELVVLITPYVLTNPEEAAREAERRLKSSDVSNTYWPRDWSESPLRNDEPNKKIDEEPKGFLKSIFTGDDNDEKPQPDPKKSEVTHQIEE